MTVDVQGVVPVGGTKLLCQEHLPLFNQGRKKLEEVRG